MHLSSHSQISSHDHIRWPDPTNKIEGRRTQHVHHNLVQKLNTTLYHNTTLAFWASLPREGGIHHGIGRCAHGRGVYPQYGPS